MNELKKMTGLERPLDKKKVAELRQRHSRFSKKIKSLPGYKEFSGKFDIEYSIAEQLHYAREKAKITQMEIARRMDTTQSVVSRIEKGENITCETLVRYAQACGARVQLKIKFD